jgi:hypothetical protein
MNLIRYNNLQRSTILRLRKRDTHTAELIELTSKQSEEYDPLLELFYRQNIIAPLMGVEYVGDMVRDNKRTGY